MLCSTIGGVETSDQQSSPPAQTAVVEPNTIVQKVSGKNPIVAAILTLLFIPLGYFYIGRLKRGIVVTIIAIVLGALTFGICGFVALVVAIYDAYKLAINEPAPLDILNKWNLG